MRVGEASHPGPGSGTPSSGPPLPRSQSQPARDRHSDSQTSSASGVQHPDAAPFSGPVDVLALSIADGYLPLRLGAGMRDLGNDVSLLTVGLGPRLLCASGCTSMLMHLPLRHVLISSLPWTYAAWTVWPPLLGLPAPLTLRCPAPCPLNMTH